MRPIIAKVLSLLETVDGLDFTITDDSITVKATADSGYSVTLWEDPHQTYVVNFGHYWHDHYSSEDKAVEWFMSGITGKFRLVCDYRWRYLVKCTVERHSDGDWMPADTVGSCLSFLVWWLPKRIVFLQNKPIQVPIGT
jgi:hypothetical protein